MKNVKKNVKRQIVLHDFFEKYMDNNETKTTNYNSLPRVNK